MIYDIALVYFNDIHRFLRGVFIESYNDRAPVFLEWTLLLMSQLSSNLVRTNNTFGRTPVGEESPE